jgi:hypothetical protein
VSNVEVELLSRDGCHLCEEALVELEKLSAERPLTVRVVDIDADPLLRNRYTFRIPVVRVRGHDLCEGRITEADLRAALAEMA